MGITGLDTRSLTNFIRDRGAPKGTISNDKSGKNQDNKVNKDNDDKEKDNVVDAEVVDPKEDKEKRA